MPLVDFQSAIMSDLHPLWTHPNQASFPTISLKLLITVITGFQFAQSSCPFLGSVLLDISALFDRIDYALLPEVFDFQNTTISWLFCVAGYSIFVNFFHVVLLILIAYKTCSALRILSFLRTLFLSLPSKSDAFPFFFSSHNPNAIGCGNRYSLYSPFRHWNHSLS